MIKKYAIADSIGRVSRIVTCGEEEIDAQLDIADTAYEAIGTVSDLTHYVDNGELLPKQVFPFIFGNMQIIASGIDECVISNVPLGTIVVDPRDGWTTSITDGTFAFSVDLAGTYKFKFSGIPYLDQEVSIEAIAAT